MKVPIRINITEKGRELEGIAKGDILVFPDKREEVVKITDINEGRLYTQRIMGNIEEKVLYELEKTGDSYLFNLNCNGVVYMTSRIRKNEKFN